MSTRLNTRSSTDAAAWRTRVVTVAGLWLGVCAIAVGIFHAPTAYGLLALVFATAAAVVLLFLDTSARHEAATWVLADEDPVRPPGEDPRLWLLRRTLDSHLDGHSVGDALHRHLTALADQRLLAHHGVSRSADPERAAALLGPELARFLETTAPFPRLDPRQIDVLIDRIEAL